jgi:hypothetical protein
MRRFYHMHTRTRLIYNRSRSADLCVCASYIVSFQNVHIYICINRRGYQIETRQKTLSNKLLKMILISSSTMADLTIDVWKEKKMGERYNLIFTDINTPILCS